ncbi:MAG: alkaline phosphatase family protein, partial [Mailhella sp.]|nr:alkaline phosphatase family protein [Mailhella sp.]
FYTIRTGEWSDAFDAEGLLENGGTKTIRMRSKLLGLDPDDASGLKLYFSHALNKDGELWCYPPEKAAGINKGNNISTNNTLMAGLGINWIDLDTWMELIAMHYDWLGDTAEALLRDGDWDILYCHAHPTDYIYHVLMTDLDSNTCSSKKAYDKAWECHRKLYAAADRYLGRLLAMFDDDTLVTLISDHGATPDGPQINPEQIFTDAGLFRMEEPEIPEWAQELPENIRVAFIKMKQKIDYEHTLAVPERVCYAFVNLKGRDPGGIVEPEDYEKVQDRIIRALLDYKDPETGEYMVNLALKKRDAQLLGLWGEQVGDVVYSVKGKFSAQHGNILPTDQYGEVGDLRALCVFYGPELGIKKGYSMERRISLTDLVPTYCYLTGLPIPKDAEGSVIYQMLEDPDFRP